MEQHGENKMKHGYVAIFLSINVLTETSDWLWQIGSVYKHQILPHIYKLIEINENMGIYAAWFSHSHLYMQR